MSAPRLAPRRPRLREFALQFAASLFTSELAVAAVLVLFARGVA